MRINGWLIGLAATTLMASATVALAQDKKPEAKPTNKPAPAAKQETGKQDTAKPGGGDDMAAAMKAMEEAGRVGENHKMLADYMAGEWTYENKMYQGPEPEISTGTCSTKVMYGGRYLHSVHKGSVKMPGPDGNMVDTPFEGTGLTGYDNVKKKFIGTWCDNFSTAIMMSEGTYDAATKTFTYHGECPDCMNGNKPMKIKEVVRVLSKDKHVFEWYEIKDGKETKTMEITYSRKS